MSNGKIERIASNESESIHSEYLEDDDDESEYMSSSEYLEDDDDESVYLSSLEDLEDDDESDGLFLNWTGSLPLGQNGV